ncbi:MAG: hypothetical protein ACOCSL_01655 [Thermoplasmatota archaeon]
MSKDKKNKSDSSLENRLKELEKETKKPTQITRVKRLEQLQDKLERKHSVKRLKKIEKFVLYPQIFLVIFIFLLSIYLKGFSLEPLYIPMYTALIILGLWTILLSIELLVFKLLEIKYRSSKSSNVLISKKSIRKAYQFSIIFLLIFTFFFVPFFTNELSDFSSIEKEIELAKGKPKTINFTSRDQLNFMVTKSISVEILKWGDDNLNGTVDIRLYEKSNYEDDEEHLYINRDSDDPNNASADKTFHYQFDNRDFEQNLLYMNSTENLTVEYKIERMLPKEKIYYFSIVSITLGISFVGWIFLLNTVKKEQSKESIYH